MAISLGREAVLVRLSLNHHQFLLYDGEEKTLARKGCLLHFVFLMSSGTTSRVFPYPSAAGILCKMTSVHLGRLHTGGGRGGYIAMKIVPDCHRYSCL